MSKSASKVSSAWQISAVA